MPKLLHLVARDHTLELGRYSKIMGIVNITPDSFSHDGCMQSSKNIHATAYRRALAHIRDGADILDVGGESTRPGANRVLASEEMARILPVIKKLVISTRTPISVDTNKAVVAKAALDAGAHIINNIKGVRPNIALLKMVARYHAGIVLMHIGQGTPKTMQNKISYDDIITDIIAALQESIEKCLEIGIKSDRIIIDPGICFGKTVEHNLMIINRLEKFQALNQPILIGTSRKSFIGKILNNAVHQRLIGTVATVAASIHHGAHILRVHDVKAIRDTVHIIDSIRNEEIRDNA